MIIVGLAVNFEFSDSAPSSPYEALRNTGMMMLPGNSTFRSSTQTTYSVLCPLSSVFCPQIPIPPVFHIFLRSMKLRGMRGYVIDLVFYLGFGKAITYTRASKLRD